MNDADNKGCHHTILMMHRVALPTDNSNSERAGELEDAPPVSLEKDLVGRHLTVELAKTKCDNTHKNI
jgi:hypothetical protein